MKAAAMSHRMIEFPVSSGNSHRVKEADVKEIIEPIPDTKPKYLAIQEKEIEKEDFTGMKKLEIKAILYIRHTPAWKRPRWVFTASVVKFYLERPLKSCKLNFFFKASESFGLS